MKFLLDVCTSSRSLRKLLDDLGHDVRLAGDVDPRMPDDALLEMARQDSRVLITEDKDFGELVFVQRVRGEGSWPADILLPEGLARGGGWQQERVKPGDSGFRQRHAACK